MAKTSLDAFKAKDTQFVADWLKSKSLHKLVLYLKVFKNHLHYLWHVGVLSIKPCLHTQLPEHNKSFRKVSRGWGHLITWNGPMIWTAFRPREGGIFQKFSKNSNARGGMLKLRFDWYIKLVSRPSYFMSATIDPFGYPKLTNCTENFLPVWPPLGRICLYSIFPIILNFPLVC